MRKPTHVAAFAAILCVAAPVCFPWKAEAAQPSRRDAAREEPGLVGTWRLVRFENRMPDGRVIYPFGEHPGGYFVYDATGHLSVQLMHNPPLNVPPGSAPSFDDTADARAFDAYFGRYRVDKAHHVLHHLVEGALNPDYVAHPDQLRPYSLRGDTLIIEMKDPSGKHFYRELHRVK